MKSQAQATQTTESHFSRFREQIVGIDQVIETPFGLKKLIYADWTASGRLYMPIEQKMLHEFGPMVGNTHTETSTTGMLMTLSYHKAHSLIKQHVNAGAEDVIITCGSGMTGAINKFQRILGLRIPEKLQPYCEIPPNERPLVIVTHMEHHSNHTSWLETIADVECIHPDTDGLVDMAHLDEILEKYKDRPYKIGAITSCSNVTGIFTPYHQIAKRIHQANGVCFVDFACSAPYVNIDMHPEDPMEKLDAIYFSPHKFLGGPGTPGVLIFDAKLYSNRVPDHPGGGTVTWTNPWGGHSYITDIELREDGGTPPFLQTIKAALCVQLKDKMDTDAIREREHEMAGMVFPRLEKVSGLHMLAGHIRERLCVFSFYVDGLHYNLGVRLLNDRFGIQVRGGCSCAGTYGHYLLNVSKKYSKKITKKIDHGDLSEKPGWIRMSLHPSQTDSEISYILDGIEALATNFAEWGKEYRYDPHTNEFSHKDDTGMEQKKVAEWFDDI
jgi:selenocysteine lyase/cysteine desulfurase